MLTPELVRVKRSGSELSIAPLSGARRARALELGRDLLGAARGLVGGTRGELGEALSAVPCAPADRKLAAGLAKLVLDQCTIEEREEFDAAALRRQVFLRAAEQRQGSEPFSRSAVLESVAAENGLTAVALDAGLYVDLKSEHVVRSAPVIDAEQLLEHYERSAIQAVLLRAVRVTATVVCAQPAALRELFRKLKFRRLLFRIERLDARRHRIEIDGPFSLFESVTKYGLQLAQVLPALEAADELELDAELRWGKTREPLRLRLSSRGGSANGGGREPRLPDDVQTLLDALKASEGPWRARVSSAILDLPGVGLCIPDLEFVHRDSDRRVFLEVLGYWSRDAVWRRVELAERGLSAPILFAVSSRLRVSQDVLDETSSAALYVYKGVISPRAVLERISRLGA